MSDNNKARIVRTITDLGYAPITAIDDDGKPTYGDVIWLPHHRADGGRGGAGAGPGGPDDALSVPDEAL